MKKSILMCVCLLLAFGTIATAADVPGWEAFVIRKASDGTSPQINDVVVDGKDCKEFVINKGSMKAGWGTNCLNGLTIGDITSLLIERLDDLTRYPTQSGPATAPYFNIWVTDGAGKYAVVANEPSNHPSGYCWDIDQIKLATLKAKAYENADLSWINNYDDGDGILTFGEIGNLVIEAPSVELLAAGWPGLGGGAPRELGTNLAYGFNWVFGDTQSNYVSGEDGYIVTAPTVAPCTIEIPCITLKDQLLTYSAGHYLEGQLIPVGYDVYGYNYQAHMFNGSYANVYLGRAGLPPYEGDDDLYFTRLDQEGIPLADATGHWAWPSRHTDLIMKWNDAWLANTDCDGDGLLDRHHGFDSYIGSGGWLTNHMSGSYEIEVKGRSKKAHWSYFTKIVSVPEDASLVDGIWYNADGTEIGPVIWGSFATIQVVENDPYADINGNQYNSPAGPGFGQYLP